MNDASRLPLFDFAQRLPGGIHMPARMTVLPLAQHKLALVSPVPISEPMAREIAALGEVSYLIAPNALHHLYMADAQKRYPTALTLAPHALRAKRPDLRIDHDLDAGLPEALASSVSAVAVRGTRGIDELVFFHHAARTLVVTDLVFNLVHPKGFLANVLLFLTGVRGRLAQSRVWSLATTDKAALARSIEELLAFPFDNLVVAHGDVIYGDARARLTEALRHRLPARQALPAAR